MIRVTLKFVGGSASKFKMTPEQMEIEPNTTVGQLINILRGEYLGTGTAGQSNLPMAVIVNGRSIYTLNGLETILKDGDTVVFVPFLAGG